MFCEFITIGKLNNCVRFELFSFYVLGDFNFVILYSFTAVDYKSKVKFLEVNVVGGSYCY